MTSIDSIYRKNQTSFNEFSQIKCDFCSHTFSTDDDLNTHILDHFEKKNCLNCDKLVLRIGSKWYELHIDDIKTDEPDVVNGELSGFADSTVEVKLNFNDGLSNFETSCHGKDINDYKSMCSPDPIIGTDLSDEYLPKHERNRKRTKGKKMSSIIDKLDPESTRIAEKRKVKLPRIKCRICDRIILEYNFEMHLQKLHVPNVIVSKERIKCETCGKTFANSGNLKTHQAIHSGTKRFVCSYCGISFRQLYHLTEHVNAHTGNRPYQCQFCEKSFGRLHILKTHQRIHTGERPHKCTINGCDRAYAYDIDLKRHKFSAHGIYTKKHICSFCSKVFSENKLLKKHLASHSAGNIRRTISKV